MIVRTQNPALRHELSFEMGQVESDTSLHFGKGQDDQGSHRTDPEKPVPVLHKDQKCHRKEELSMSSENAVVFTRQRSLSDN